MPIKPVPDESASPDVLRIFQAMRKAGVPVTPFIRMLAINPPVLRAYNQLVAALWAPTSQLSEALKDLAYLRASILNGCRY